MLSGVVLGLILYLIILFFCVKLYKLRQRRLHPIFRFCFKNRGDYQSCDLIMENIDAMQVNENYALPCDTSV